MKSVSIAKTISLMNDYVSEHTNQFAWDVFCKRMECNSSIVNHPSIQIGWHDEKDTLSFLGFINGIFGVDNLGMGAISRNDNVNKLRFFRIDPSRIGELQADERYYLRERCDELHMVEIFKEAVELDKESMVKFFLSDMERERLRFLTVTMFDEPKLFEELCTALTVNN